MRSRAAKRRTAEKIGNFDGDNVRAFLDGRLLELRSRAGRAEVLSAVLQEKLEANNLDRNRLEYLADAMRVSVVSLSVVSLNNYVQELLSDLSKMNRVWLFHDDTRREQFRSLDQLEVWPRGRQRVGDRAVGVA
jgi:hypothetical protein